MTVSSVCGFWCQLLVFRVESNKKNNMKFASWVVFVVIYFSSGVFILHTETMFSLFPILFFRLILLGKHTYIIIIYIKRYARWYYTLWAGVTDATWLVIYSRRVSPPRHLSSVPYNCYVYVADTLLGNIIMTPLPPPHRCLLAWHKYISIEVHTTAPAFWVDEIWQTT